MIYTQEEIKNKFEKLVLSSPIYEKHVTIKAFMANVPTRVMTKVERGDETVNIAEPGDFIVINPDGERYVVKADMFEKKHEPIDNYPPTVVQRYKSKGKIHAFDYEGPEFEYEAPWGSKAKCWDGGKIVTPYPTSEKVELYCIAPKEFKNTYRKLK